MSSHFGASTVEAQRETSTEIARVVSGYLLGGDFTNAVNAGENIEVEEKPSTRSSFITETFQEYSPTSTKY